MVEGFRISSDMLLERLKDLESVNFAGERPQTAQVLGRIQGSQDVPLSRPSIMNDIRPPEILNLETNESQNLPNTNSVNPQTSELQKAKQTIETYRNSKT